MQLKKKKNKPIWCRRCRVVVFFQCRGLTSVDPMGSPESMWPCCCSWTTASSAFWPTASICPCLIKDGGQSSCSSDVCVLTCRKFRDGQVRPDAAEPSHFIPSVRLQTESQLEIGFRQQCHLLFTQARETGSGFSDSTVYWKVGCNIISQAQWFSSLTIHHKIF